MHRVSKIDTRVAYAEEGINDGANKEAITIIRIKKVKIVRFKRTYILHQHCLYNFELTYAPMLTIGYSTCILWTILSCIMCHELEGQQVEVPDQSHTCRLNNAFMCIKIILKYIKKLFKKKYYFFKMLLQHMRSKWRTQVKSCVRFVYSLKHLILSLSLSQRINEKDRNQENGVKQLH